MRAYVRFFIISLVLQFPPRFFILFLYFVCVSMVGIIIAAVAVGARASTYDARFSFLRVQLNISHAYKAYTMPNVITLSHYLNTVDTCSLQRWPRQRRLHWPAMLAMLILSYNLNYFVVLFWFNHSECNLSFFPRFFS